MILPKEHKTLGKKKFISAKADLSQNGPLPLRSYLWKHAFFKFY